MSYELNTVVDSFAEDEESSEKTIIVNLDDRHTAILSKKYDEISIAVFDGKYNDYCTKEVFPEYNQDIISCGTYEAKRLIKDMLMMAEDIHIIVMHYYI